MIKIEIHRAYTCIGGGELLYDFCGRFECLFDRGMQPPAISFADELRTAHQITIGEIATERVYFEPGPARAGPDFEHDRTGTTLAPKACVEGSFLIPRSGRDWWPHPERPTLALLRLFGFVFLLTCSPFVERGEEGASRAERSIDSSASEHSRDIWREIGEWHDRIGVGLRCMREFLQGREGPLIFEGKNTFVCLDDFKIKGHDQIEEDLVCREVGSILRRIV